MTFETLEARCLLAYTPAADPRVVTEVMAGWKFLRADASGAQATSFNDSAWSTVNLPHTWNATDAQDGGTLYYRGIGWYRKSLAVPAALAGKQVFLQFEGVSLAGSVYVNGTLAGSHMGGFQTFNLDVTSLVTPGANAVIAVKVDNGSALNSQMPPQGGDYPQFGGIYRDVRLIGVDRGGYVSLSDFGSIGVYVRTQNVSAASADVGVKALVRNSGAVGQTLRVVTDLVDPSGNLVDTLDSAVFVDPGATATVDQTTTLLSPRLWNGKLDPALYAAYVTVRDESGAVVRDTVRETFGVRSFAFDANQGFLLNGQRYDLHGVSLHQDRLNKGWAISDADITQDLSIANELGATIIRLSHYQHSQLTYDLADQLGLIVYTELPINTTITSISQQFVDNSAQQLRELIRQNTNHPSVVTWGLYNEINDSAATQNLIRQMDQIANAEDPSRPTTAASDKIATRTLETIPDTIAFNKYFGWYEGTTSDYGPWLDAQRASVPGRVIGVSEYGAGGSIKQHRQNPPPSTPVNPWHPEEYQSKFHEQVWPQLAARPWLWSKIVWNLFDFAADHRNEGDTAGRNDKGLVTYDRATKKDAFYYYKAQWSTDPVLYIASRRWTKRIVPTTDIKVYANTGPVTLKVNGVTVGTRSDTDGTFDWSNVTLKSGANTVTVTGVRDGVTYTDTVTWTYTPEVILTGSTKINFQTSGATTPSGFLADTGAAYGLRSNGKTYGWDVANTSNTRLRGASPDARLDTLNHLQQGRTYKWEAAVANGTYKVKLFMGDPVYDDSVNNVKIENVTVNDADGADNFDQVVTTVTVSDGRLTITPASGASKSKVLFLEFVKVTTATAAAREVSSASNWQATPTPTLSRSLSAGPAVRLADEVARSADALFSGEPLLLREAY
jgi:beta-galactosidase